MKNTIQNMKKLAETRGGRCLSDVYLNNYSYLKWKCAKGHIWNAVPNNIKRGSWCLKCSIPIRVAKRKLLMKDIIKQVEDKGGKCFLSKYINSSTNFECRCEKGHVWKTTAHRLRSGHWCPICAVKENAAKRRLLFKDIKKWAKDRGGKCLSIVYVNDSTKLKWQCEKGHEWEATVHGIRSGSWCPKCGAIRRAEKKKLTIGDMRKLAKSLGGQCLSTIYKDSNSKIKWQCKKGHIWESVPSSVKAGHWCLICAGKSKLTIEKMREWAKKHHGECLSPQYINAFTKLLWKCRYGHIWEARPNDIQNGCWCSECSGKKKLTIEKMRKLATLNMGKCLSVSYINSSTKLEWVCKKGHTFWMKPNTVTQGGWCPICIESKSESICREVFEEMFKDKFVKIKPKWLRNPKTGGLMELDGYCKNLELAFEHNGIQHYKISERFHTSEKGFEELKARDNLKKKLCKKHGVRLIVIPQLGYKIDGHPKLTVYNIKDYILKQFSKKEIKRFYKCL